MLYTVTVCNVAPTIVPRVEPQPVNVTSTAYGSPVFTEITREHLLRLRHDIVESGVPLKDEAELEREISEMRGR
jgi:hypothetical protein